MKAERRLVVFKLMKLLYTVSQLAQKPCHANFSCSLLYNRKITVERENYEGAFRWLKIVYNRGNIKTKLRFEKCLCNKEWKCFMQMYNTNYEKQFSD